MSRVVEGHGGTGFSPYYCGGDWGNDHAAMRMLDLRLGGGGVAGTAIIVGCVHG
jgi:hypothetical protein